MSLLIDYVSSSDGTDEGTWKGYLYAVALLVSTASATVLTAKSSYLAYNVGMDLKTTVTSAIYRKVRMIFGGS